MIKKYYISQFCQKLEPLFQPKFLYLQLIFLICSYNIIQQTELIGMKTMSQKLTNIN